MTGEALRDRFEGALLGLSCGDALGMPFENWSLARIAATAGALDAMRPAALWLRLYAAAHGLIHDPVHGIPRLPLGAGTYTDDSQMMVAVAESLVERGGFDGEDMARRFVEAYDPRRGYGPGTAKVLRALRRGVPWDQAGEVAFRGRGSFGNGAAMRTAPIGLLYWRQHDALVRVAEQAARITHAHPAGRDGAVVMATAIAEALRAEDPGSLQATAFLSCLRQAAHTDGFRTRLQQVESLLAAEPTPQAVSETLGNRTSALDSVPAAIYSVLRNPGSLEASVRFAVRLGGDTDTIGAMAGALAGALHGVAAIPRAWLDALEDGPRGRDHVRDLAGRLYAMSEGQRS